MTLSVGDTLPSATFKTLTPDGPVDLPSEEVFAGRVAVFAVPGAFTPTCSNSHMPSFVNNVGKLREKGVDRVVCVSVNDPFVMGAWAEATGADKAGLVMACDSDASFTRAVGLDFDGSARGLGVRSRRYSMLVEDGVVRALNVEEAPGKATCSTGDELLKQL